MKKLLLLLLLPALALAQTAVQKVGGGNNRLSNGSVIVPNGISITAEGTGIIQATSVSPSFAVPYTQISLVPTATLLGRTTAATGAAEALTVGTSLSLGAGSLNTIQDIRTTASPTFAALTLTAPLTGANGGTGVANTGKTITLGGNFTTSGAFGLTLTLSALTNVTLPITGTLATLAGIETLTNKSISGSTNTLTNIPNSALTNNSLTIGSTNIALGTTSAALAGLTSLGIAQTGSFNGEITLSSVAASSGSSRIRFQDTGADKWAIGYNVGGANFGIYDYTATAGLALSFTAGTKAATFTGNVISTNSGTNSFTGNLVSLTGGQFTGNGSQATGSWIELGHIAGNGYVQSFNRTGAAYTPLRLIGSGVELEVSGVDALTVGATGVTQINLTSGYKALTLKRTAGNGSLLKFENFNGSTQYNFFVGQNYNTADAFEIIPSTAADGDTVGSTVFSVSRLGAVSATGGISASGVLSSSGGLTITGGTGATVFPAGTTAVGMHRGSSVPTVTWVQSSQAADSRIMDAIYSAGIWSLRGMNDAYNSATDRLMLSNSTGGSLTIPGVGPHAFGGATLAAVQWYLRGSYSPTGSTSGDGLLVGSSLTIAAGNDASLLRVSGTLIEAGSGTHVNFSGARFDAPTITGGAASLTNASTVRITGAPTGATNNYALQVSGITNLTASTLPTNAALLRVDNTSVTGTAYGTYSTAEGAATTNVAGYFSASNAATNVAIRTGTGLVELNGRVQQSASGAGSNAAQFANPSATGDGVYITTGATSAARYALQIDTAALASAFVVKGDGATLAGGTLGATTAGNDTGISLFNSANGNLLGKISRDGGNDRGAFILYSVNSPTLLLRAVGASTFPGDITLAGDLTVSGGNVGVGTAIDGNRMLVVGGTHPQTTNSGLMGIGSDVTFPSTNLTNAYGIYARVTTAAAAFTLVNSNTLYIDSPVVGAGSSITTQWGVRILNQGATGITHAYGIDIAAQSGAATTNVGLRNAGTTLLNAKLTVTTAGAGAGTATFASTDTNGGWIQFTDTNATTSGNFLIGTGTTLNGSPGDGVIRNNNNSNAIRLRGTAADWLALTSTTATFSGSVSAGAIYSSAAAALTSANTTILDNNAGTGRVIARGPDVSNNAPFGIFSTRSDGTNSLTFLSFTNTGNGAVGTSSGINRKFHVFEGSSGASSHAQTTMVIEDGGPSYLSFLSPNTADVGILFSDPESTTAGQVTYNHSTNALVLNGGSITVGLSTSITTTFSGSVSLSSATTGYVEGIEQSSDPAAPAANAGRLYWKDSGGGKTQLVARFNTGAVQVIATEP